MPACPWAVEAWTADDLLSASALWRVERAVRGHRAIRYRTAGTIVIRTTGARVVAGIGSGGLPRLAEVADRPVPLTAEDTCANGLGALVDGLFAGVSGGRAPGR